MLQNYATAGIYGLAHDLPYCRRSHMGILVDYDYIKRLGTMRFRLRRCCASLSAAGSDFQIVDMNDSLEAWAFQLVFWEPCSCTLKSPFSYDFYRVWLSSKDGVGSVLDCKIPVLLNSSRSVDVSEGKWMVALENYTPIRTEKDENQQRSSMVLACPTLIDSEDRHILGHLGKSHRDGEDSMYGQRYSIKPASRDVLGHELRVPIDSITSIHLQLLDGVLLSPIPDPQDYEPHYVVSLVFYRTSA
jgi:hypothetical protein